MDRIPKTLVGSLAADAVAMPVHWYYDRAALQRDYGTIKSYLAPQNPHPDSILWRSAYTPINEKGEILHDQAIYWGQRGVHYHQFLQAGQNTLNFQLSRVLYDQIKARGTYDTEAWLETYIDFMLTPGRHRDTYVEEYHRHFFTNYARGKNPQACGCEDVHIGGLAMVPALFDALNLGATEMRAVVQQHVALTHQDKGVLRAADAFVRILLGVRAGKHLRDSILEEAPDWISNAKISRWIKEPDLVVIGQRLSPACYIPDAFPAALFLAWKYADDFGAGICANAQVGGDSCHRGSVVGGLLGLANDIPARWLQGLPVEREIRARF
jgi:ADP-ribosyl-[dinitrogen reductase] hydrolase